MTDDTDDGETPPQPRKPRRHVPAAASFAIIVALVALAVAAWSVVNLRRATRAEQVVRKQDAAAIAALQVQLAAGSKQAQAGSQRLDRLQSQLDDLRTSAQGLDRRIGNLESAYATLSGQQQSGHDTMLLDDAEMLLRNAQQRFDLFHDTGGAVQAYTQAIAVLAQVQNPAYAPVRASAEAERDALAASAPPSRQAALDTLAALRTKVASLPLAGAEGVPGSSAPTQKPGFWARLGRSFSGIVSVTREQGAAPSLATAGFARQALALDLAQAQEALLAFDDDAFRSALRRADATLSAHFDTDAAAVKDARAQITTLLAQHRTGPAPKLGGALAQLQSLRASAQAAAPASAGSTVPPPASSAP